MSGAVYFAVFVVRLLPSMSRAYLCAQLVGIQEYAGEALAEDGSTMFLCVLLPTTLSIVVVAYRDVFEQVCPKRAGTTWLPGSG
eukprot:m.578409 g.578409  ORF g.578409 m.578409 type:complete len:84 (+) comp22306_c1_seq11:601-852(+)